MGITTWQPFLRERTRARDTSGYTKKLTGGLIQKKSRDRYTLTTSLPYTQLYNTPPQSKVRHLSKSCVYVQRAQPHTHFSSSNNTVQVGGISTSLGHFKPNTKWGENHTNLSLTLSSSSSTSGFFSVFRVSEGEGGNGQ